jgi:hypothetical protein
MGRKSAWFLNFDAEEELARPAGYTPSRAVLARFEGLAALVGALLSPGDVVVAEGQSSRIGPAYNGRAWCPTPRARRALAKAGVALPPAPSLEVLRAVTNRGFNAGLGQTLPGARFATSLEEIEEALGQASPTGRWLLKRPWSFAGRGRLSLQRGALLSAGHAGHAGHAGREATWIKASLRSFGGLQVEPLVDRLADFARHGHVARSGEVTLGAPTRQACDATGAWKGSARALPGDLSEDELAALAENAQLAASALHSAGYFGPFGVDAFRWRDERGLRRWNPRCEINARYSMGWAVGMGAERPDLDAPGDGDPG